VHPVPGIENWLRDFGAFCLYIGRGAEHPAGFERPEVVSGFLQYRGRLWGLRLACDRTRDWGLADGHRRRILRSAVAGLRACLDWPRLRALFEFGEREIAGLLMELFDFDFVSLQGATLESQRSDLAAKVLPVAPRGVRGRHLENWTDRAEVELAAADERAIAVEAEFVAVKRGGQEVPFCRAEHGWSGEGIAFAHPENKLVGVQRQIARIFFGGISDSGQEGWRVESDVGSHPAIERPGRIGAEHGIVFEQGLVQTFAVSEEDGVERAIKEWVVRRDLSARCRHA
jgi:hypothetical protein